jgi:hypothetical protein
LLLNERIKDHEKLFYQLTVIKDQFPIISASYAPDSLKVDKALFWVKFQIYGFSKLQIVYYPKGKLEFVKRGVIPIRIDGYDQFYFLFRVSWLLNKGFYEYYFEVFDNDARMVSKAQRRLCSLIVL